MTESAVSSMIDQLRRAVDKCETVPRVGKVTQYFGMAVESNGPDVYLGEICEIYPPTHAARLVPR